MSDLLFLEINSFPSFKDENAFFGHFLLFAIAHRTVIVTGGDPLTTAQHGMYQRRFAPTFFSAFLRGKAPALKVSEIIRELRSVFT